MRLIKITNVMNLTGLSRPTIYQLMKEGKFPKQVVLTIRAVAWVEEEIENWIKDKINARGL